MGQASRDTDSRSLRNFSFNHQVRNARNGRWRFRSLDAPGFNRWPCLVSARADALHDSEPGFFPASALPQAARLLPHSVPPRRHAHVHRWDPWRKPRQTGQLHWHLVVSFEELSALLSERIGARKNLLDWRLDSPPTPAYRLCQHCRSQTTISIYPVRFHNKNQTFEHD